MSNSTLDPTAIQNLLSTVGGDKSFLAELVDTFLADAPQQIAAMKNGVANNRAEEMRRAAHSLKSNAANFGAMELARLCKQVEEMGKSNTVESAADFIAQIEAEYVRAEDALRKFIVT